MQRPPFEIRRIEEERQRRAHAHRLLRWERRRRLLAWAAALSALLLLGLLCARLLGLLPSSL
jgi:hypothetical protein